VATETRDIHIHLTAQPGTSTTVHVTVAGDTFTVSSVDRTSNVGSPNGVASADDEVETAIRRLERSGLSPNIREVTDGLLALGYTLKSPESKSGRPGNYVRFLDPNYTAHGIGYVNPSTFGFTRKLDRDRLKDLPGARPGNGVVYFPHQQSAQPGLAAAKLLKS
jgi:hypothetical protein